MHTIGSTNDNNTTTNAYHDLEIDTLYIPDITATYTSRRLPDRRQRRRNSLFRLRYIFRTALIAWPFVLFLHHNVSTEIFDVRLPRYGR